MSPHATRRVCGPCQACCTHLDIDELEKPEGVRCHHLRKFGCAVYAERPKVCRSFVCLWIVYPGWPRAWRPDRSGVLATLAKNEVHGVGVDVLELRPKAAALPRIVERCREIIQATMVRTEHHDGRREIYSADARWIDHLRRHNPKLALPAAIEAVELRGVESGEELGGLMSGSDIVAKQIQVVRKGLTWKGLEGLGRR